MATKKRTAKPATPTVIDTPVREPEPIPEQVDVEDRLAQVAKDQKKSQDAYQDTHPPEPSL